MSFLKVLTCFSSVWLFETLRTVAGQVPLSPGFSRQEYWSGLPFLPNPGMEPTPLLSPALAGAFFTSETWGAYRGSTYRSNPYTVQVCIWDALVTIPEHLRLLFSNQQHKGRVLNKLVLKTCSLLKKIKGRAGWREDNEIVIEMMISSAGPSPPLTEFRIFLSPVSTCPHQDWLSVIFLLSPFLFLSIIFFLLPCLHKYLFNDCHVQASVPALGMQTWIWNMDAEEVTPRHQGSWKEG